MGRNVHEIYKKRRIEFFCNALDRGIRGTLAANAAGDGLISEPRFQSTIYDPEGKRTTLISLRGCVWAARSAQTSMANSNKLGSVSMVL